MRHVLLCALLATVPVAAIAASDKPVFGPLPAWVRPVPLPATPPADDAPLRILLTDQQVAIEPTRQTVYATTTILIQTPQGLAAGNISLP
ncbi:hypothetical protein [Sphingomonas prati]|uniref:M23 family peptidase n=1 Tax=Sphingomonas prati TaxID=1843237 RepID=A0A7W9BVH8_9SPHN|nr:hypothetical protein [Sphingomonas prati]MBB5730418.1 hypothetical protein [Sphingomonas prati]